MKSRSNSRINIIIKAVVLMVLSLVIMVPSIKAKAEGLYGYGESDGRVNGELKQIEPQNPYDKNKKNNYKYQVEISNNTGDELKDWIVEITTNEVVSVIENDSWNILDYFSNGNKIYVYPKDKINNQENQMKSLPIWGLKNWDNAAYVKYNGFEAKSVKVYYSYEKDTFKDLINYLKENPVPTASPTVNPTPTAANATPTPAVPSAVPTATVTPAVVNPTAEPTTAVEPTKKPGKTKNEPNYNEEGLGFDNTPLGKGALQEIAEAAIVNSKLEEGPSGSVYGRLQAKVKKTTKNSITIKWKKVKGAKYIIYGNKCGKKQKYKKIATVKKNQYTKKKLKKGTYYKYIVVAVKDGRIVSSSKTLHIATKGGSVGNPKKVTVSKKSVKLKKNKLFKIKAKVINGSGVKTHRGVCFESSDESVATVTKSGMIKAVGKGKAFIYVYAQNGTMAKVKVTVK